MATPSDQSNELHALVSSMLDGTLDEAGRQQLGELLETDAEARRFYFAYIRMQTLLEATHAPILSVGQQESGVMGQGSGVVAQGSGLTV